MMRSERRSRHRPRRRPPTPDEDAIGAIIDSPALVNSALHIVILAAGQGTRMKSARPKVLHRAAGRTLVEHVLATASELAPASTTLVVGHQAEALKTALARKTIPGGLTFVVREPQLGTGHALMTAEPALTKATGTLVLLYADVPALPAATARKLGNH